MSSAFSVVDVEQVLHVITTPSALTIDVLVAARRQVLADVVGADRQLAVATVDHHRQLHRPRSAVVVERVEGGADRAAGEQHVVDEHDRRAVERDRDARHAAGHDRPEADVVAVEADVDGAARHRSPRCRASALGELLGDPHAAALQPDEHHRVEAMVALDDLVTDAGDRPTDVVGRHHGPRLQAPTSGLTGSSDVRPRTGRGFTSAARRYFGGLRDQSWTRPGAHGHRRSGPRSCPSPGC